MSPKFAPRHTSSLLRSEVHDAVPVSEERSSSSVEIITFRSRKQGREITHDIGDLHSLLHILDYIDSSRTMYSCRHFSLGIEDRMNSSVFRCNLLNRHSHHPILSTNHYLPHCVALSRSRNRSLPQEQIYLSCRASHSNGAGHRPFSMTALSSELIRVQRPYSYSLSIQGRSIFSRES